MEVPLRGEVVRVVCACSTSGGQTLAAGAEYEASEFQIHRVSELPPLGWRTFAAARRANLRACREPTSELVY